MWISAENRTVAGGIAESTIWTGSLKLDVGRLRARDDIIHQRIQEVIVTKTRSDERLDGYLSQTRNFFMNDMFNMKRIEGLAVFPQSSGRMIPPITRLGYRRRCGGGHGYGHGHGHGYVWESCDEVIRVTYRNEKMS